MRHTTILQRAKALLLALALGLSAQAATAQNPFATAIKVNNSAITNWEIDQRILLLELFRTPGDLQEIATEGLIDDRVRQELFARIGLSLSEQGLQTALTEFAGRANLGLEEFTAVLAQNGVAPETFRDYVAVNVTWRDYVRLTYADQAVISDAEVDRALSEARDTSDGIEILLSEIIIPAPPPQAAEAMARAESIARLTSTDAFSAAAREVSALPSRDNGGRLDWIPLNNMPAPLRPILLALEPGEVTAPLQIPNGVALFQLRGVREVPQPLPPAATLDYAAFYVTGGAAELARIDALVDTCDDLYGVAQGLPPELLERQEAAPSALPQDIALELAKLDPNEVSTALTRNNGQTRVFLMLCQRIPEPAAEVDREALRNELRSRRLAGYADSLLADLRAAAVITLE
jgi:peptidyl-prolyl cis-trans isomerase SurA